MGKSWTTTYRDAPNQSVVVDGNRYAFRALGQGEGTPLVLLNHWGANLDNFDPPFVDALARDRIVYALDYRGIGSSGGEVRTSVAEMATDMVGVIRALTRGPVDLFGFSLGGFVAQQIALTEPELVRRLILAGTAPAGGVGGESIVGVLVRATIKAFLTRRDPKYYLFFTKSAASRRAGAAYLARLKERVVDRDEAVGKPEFKTQLTAIKAWAAQPPQPLEGIARPVLIANGDEDIMAPTRNSTEMAGRIPGAELVIYPDAGHGGIFQHHEAFTERVRSFLA